MAKEFKMSQARYDELKKELDYSKTTRADEVAELIKLIIKCMDEKEEFYLEEVKGLTRALLMQIARWNEKDETQEKNAILDDASIALILPALNYIGENFHGKPKQRSHGRPQHLWPEGVAASADQYSVNAQRLGRPRGGTDV